MRVMKAAGRMHHLQDKILVHGAQVNVLQLNRWPRRAIVPADMPTDIVAHIVHCSKHFHHGRFSCDVDAPMRHPLCRVMHTFLPTEPVKIRVRSCKTTSLTYPWSGWPTAHAFSPVRTVVSCGPPLTGGVRVHREKPAARCRV